MFCPALLGMVGNFPSVVACSSDPATAATQLQSYLRCNPFDWVIVADEELLRALIDGRSLDSRTEWFPVDPADSLAVDLLASKYTFIERADALGLSVPTNRFAASADEAVAYAQEIGYPVFLKGEHGFAGLQVRCLTDDQGVRRVAERFLQAYSRVLVQGRIGGIPVSACVLYDRGKLSAYKTFMTECEYPGRFSPSTVHQYFAHPAIEPVLSALGEATKFHGLAGVDFMYDPALDKLFVIEMNPRPTIGFAGAAANRAFFAPAIERFLRRGSFSAPDVYDGREPAQCYFPSYLFYLATRPDWHDRRLLDRLRASIHEFRPREWRLVLFEIVRFFGGRLKKAATVVLSHRKRRR